MVQPYIKCMLIAFPMQQWSYERASLLRCTYITCLVLCYS